jgi:hypothetical protein
LLSIILLTTSQAKSQVRGSLPEPEHKVAKFYPNPAVSYITFELVTNNKDCDLQIYSFIGRLVKHVTGIQDKTTVNLSDLTRGVYTFQLKDETGRITDTGIFQVIK